VTASRKNYPWKILINNETYSLFEIRSILSDRSFFLLSCSGEREVEAGAGIFFWRIIFIAADRKRAQ
jgi:hypothetical protein